MVQVRRAAGYRDRTIKKSRYDLVLSNILARPLGVLAADLARNMAPKGRAILSGLLRRQEPIVLAPHRGFGLVLERRLVVDGWSTLILRAQSRSEIVMEALTPLCASGSGEGPIRPPCAVQISPVSGRKSTTRTDRALAPPRRGIRFANGESRYRRASDRREPSARHKSVPAAAIARRLSRPR